MKRYHLEDDSKKIEDLFQKPDCRFLVSRLALVELRSTFARLVREKILSQTDFTYLIQRLDADVAAGSIVIVALSYHRLADAAKILETVGLEENIRTLDSLQLATAIAVHRRTRLAGFVAADKKLINVANKCSDFNVVAIEI